MSLYCTDRRGNNCVLVMRIVTGLKPFKVRKVFLERQASLVVRTSL